MREVIDEMLGLTMFPLRRIDAKSSFTERIRIVLAELGEFNFR